MAKGTRLAAWLSSAMLAAAVTCGFGAHAGAQATPILSVAVGETAATSLGHSPALARALRSALESELSTLGGVRLASPRHARWVLRGTVTRFDHHRVGRDLEVRCVVSLIVAERRGGAVRMFLSGRAGARGGAAPASLEDAALHAAVRGAIRPLGRQLVAMR